MQAPDLIFFLFAGVAAWLLLVRPQRARAKALQEVREALEVGSRVITTAGLHATIAAIEDGTVLLEIAPGVNARFASSAVVRVLTDTEDTPDEDPPAPPDQGEAPAD